MQTREQVLERARPMIDAVVRLKMAGAAAWGAGLSTGVTIMALGSLAVGKFESSLWAFAPLVFVMVVSYTSCWYDYRRGIRELAWWAAHLPDPPEEKFHDHP